MTECPPDRTRWRQIAGVLQQLVAALPPGARLPTEAALAAQHGVNRHTIRRAIDSLGRAGLVRSEQGRGSFVAEDVLEYEVQPRTRFSEWVRRNNRQPVGQLVQLRVLAAPPEVAEELRLAPDAPVTMLERLGLADQVPVSLSRSYFDAARFPGLSASLRDATSVTTALLAEGVADYQRARTRVTARMPAAAEASLLRIARTRPVLVCANLDVELDGQPVAFGYAVYPSNRVQVLFEPSCFPE